MNIVLTNWAKKPTIIYVNNVIYYTFSSESSRSVAKRQKSNFQDPTDLHYTVSKKSSSSNLSNADIFSFVLGTT